MSVSVIIPSFNRAHVIERAIDSVLAQQGIDALQCIVVDDGSNDGTDDLVRERYPQVLLLQQANQGVSAARNTGLRAATGEWLALLDSDDEWLPHKLRSQLDQLQESNVLVSHTEEIWVRNGVRVNQHAKHAKRGGWIFEHCLPLCAMSPSSILMHRDVVEVVGEFDETLPACEDYDYWLRLTAEFEVAFLAEPAIIKYGGHADQLSRKHWGMDRFRVSALQKILGGNLSDQNRSAAERMLVEKLQILLNGAMKHDNRELIASCEASLQALDSDHAAP